MNKKIYRCLECGWIVEADEHSLKCPMCHSRNVRVEIDSEVDDGVASYIEELGGDNKCQVLQMEDNIKTLGNSRTWELIEKMDIASIRVMLRSYFFSAGGVCPVNIDIDK